MYQLIPFKTHGAWAGHPRVGTPRTREKEGLAIRRRLRTIYQNSASLASWQQGELDKFDDRRVRLREMAVILEDETSNRACLFT